MADATGLAAPSHAGYWLRPRIVLPILGVVLVLALLWTPEIGGTTDDPRLTTYSTSPSGAAGFREVAERLGWRTERRRTQLDGPLDTADVYAVLAPILPVSRHETHQLMEAVRHGAGLVYVIRDSSALGDSLHIKRSDSGYTMWPITGASTAGCPRARRLEMIPWFQNGVHLYRLLPHGPPLADTSVFVEVTRPSGVMSPTLAPAALGFPVGSGRVVVLSDPDLLRNDVIRVCRWGIGARMITALDWVSRGRRPLLVFDEYHQRFGLQAGVWRAVHEFLVDTVPGRVLAQLIAAALVLLIALGVRPIAPRGVARIERRSPLEHVDALARAYERIGATRVAARRMARGLRRRHGGRTWSASPSAATAGSPAAGVGAGAEERFLTALASRHPEIAADASLIIDAEHRVVSPAGLVAVADAVDRIDRVFPSPKP